ncbi:MAG: IclR family transcriptional regulator [Alphaproteobacteria bacterium]
MTSTALARSLEADAETREPVPRTRRKPVARQVPAVTRAIAILRLLGKTDAPLGVNSIARALGLVPSTCLHILRVLVAEELVACDPETKHYSLDEGILALARSVLRRNSFGHVVQPMLNEMSQRYGVAVVGVKVSGLDHIVVVAIAKSEQPMRIHVEIGSRFPALISSTGRCLAAFGGYPMGELEARVRALRWDRPPSLKRWRAEVAAARRNGYSVDEGNYMSGITVMAAPVLGRGGRMTHGVVAVGVSEQIRRHGTAKLGEALKAIAARVSGEFATG